MEALVWFAFVGCVIAGMASIVFLLLYAMSKSFRHEVNKDFLSEHERGDL